MERIEMIRKMLEENPDDNFLEHALALECLKKQDEEQAVALLTRVLNRDEDYIGSYYHLAGLLAKLGKTEQALEWYEKGMKKAKALGDQHAYNELQSAHDDLID